jgi:peroxiredoxin
MISPLEEGSFAPGFNLPVAQGGRLRLDLRTARGPVIVAFYRGAWSGECVEYFTALAEKEREINVAGATLVGIGAVEPGEAREFVRETGFKSYVLYDYLRVTTREYGLLQQDSEHGDAARPAVFLIGSDDTVLRAWLDERPAPEDLLAEVSKITGLPKEPEEEEAEEKPKKRPRKAAEGETNEPEASGGDSESGQTRRAAKSAPANSEDDAKEGEEGEEGGGGGGGGAPAPENAVPGNAPPEDGERPPQNETAKPADGTRNPEAARSEDASEDNESAQSPEGGGEKDKSGSATQERQSDEAGSDTLGDDGAVSPGEPRDASQEEER